MMSECISSTLSLPSPSTSSSSHSFFISCSSPCTFATTLRAVVTLRTSIQRIWTFLTTPTSSHEEEHFRKCISAWKSSPCRSVKRGACVCSTKKFQTCTLGLTSEMPLMRYGHPDSSCSRAQICTSELLMEIGHPGTSCLCGLYVDRNTSHVISLMHLAHVFPPHRGSRRARAQKCLSARLIPSTCHP